MKNQCDLDDAKSLLLNDAEIRVVPRFSADPLLAELDRRHVLADEPGVPGQERGEQPGEQRRQACGEIASNLAKCINILQICQKVCVEICFLPIS